MLHKFKQTTKISDFDIKLSQYKFDIGESLLVKIEVRI